MHPQQQIKVPNQRQMTASPATILVRWEALNIAFLVAVICCVTDDCVHFVYRWFSMKCRF
jgi:hypothetical protein